MSTRVVTSALTLLGCALLTPATAAASDPPPSATDDIRSAAARHGAGTVDPDHAGMWKAATPPSGSTRGEFDDNDPVGLSAGKRIRADCSVNWLDPDTGKRYCFSTATSLVSFLTAPHQYLLQAGAVWTRLRSLPER
jgi:hypothetical protein